MFGGGFHLWVRWEQSLAGSWREGGGNVDVGEAMTTVVRCGGQRSEVAGVVMTT